MLVAEQMLVAEERVLAVPQTRLQGLGVMPLLEYICYVRSSVNSQMRQDCQILDTAISVLSQGF